MQNKSLPHFLWVGLLLVTFVEQLTADEAIRTWNDASGLYKVRGRVVTFDPKLVVIETRDGQLEVLRRQQLAAADQQYLQALVDSPTTKMAAQPTRPSEPPLTTTVEPTIPPGDRPGSESPPTPARRAPGQPTTEEQAHPANDPVAGEWSQWRLRNGDQVAGTLIGFGTQQLVLLRREGQVWVDQVLLNELPENLAWIVVAIVAGIDQIPLNSRAELEQHLAKGGGGPFEYVVQGVQLATEEGGKVTIPPPLLEADQAPLVAAGLARWQAAQGEEVTSEERYATESRERLLLDSYHRLSPLNPVAARQLKFIELGLLAADAGVTELWEVELLAPVPYILPRSVVVPGRDSATARQVAAMAYPAWRVGAVRKLSD